jgi:hypothetical protein
MDRSKYLLPDRWWPAWQGLIIYCTPHVRWWPLSPGLIIYSLYQVVDSIGIQGVGLGSCVYADFFVEFFSCLWGEGGSEHLSWLKKPLRCL